MIVDRDKKERHDRINMNKHHSTPLNILLLGYPGQGKSSFANSCYRCLKFDKLSLPCPISDSDICTTRVKEVPHLRNKVNIRLFDTPGFHICDPKAVHDVEKLLNGVPEDTLLKDIGSVDCYTENKIHFVIVVYSCEEFQEQSGYFWGYRSKFPKNWISPEVVQCIELLTTHPPVLVLSNADKMKLSEEHYINKAKTRFPSGNIHFVENYTRTKQQRKEKTEEVIEAILLNFLVLEERDEKPTEKIKPTSFRAQPSPHHTNSNTEIESDDEGVLQRDNK